MKQIKLKIVDNNHPETDEYFYKDRFVKWLQKHFDVVHSDDPDFLIYGPYGYRHTAYPRAVKIFISYEVTLGDYAVADYVIDYEYQNYCDRHLRYPFSFWNAAAVRAAQSKHLRAEQIAAGADGRGREKFCSYMVSVYSKDCPRDEFFKQLSEYKRVDSGGRHLNNLGGGYIADKIAWLEDYKFNICFENAASVGYFTEKLIDAHAGGCVPIYWGDPSLLRPELLGDFKEYELNPRAFINVQSYASFAEAIEAIKEIDADDAKYRAMLAEPAFIGDFDWLAEYERRAEEFMLHIFSQPPELARRVAATHYVRRHLRDKYSPINTQYLRYLSKKLRGKA